MIHHPYPLNMRSARAFGSALTAENGDVVLVGGFTRMRGEQLLATDWAFERFNASTGLFDEMVYHEPDYPAHGLSGVAHMSDDWHVIVGGARSVEIPISGTGTNLKLALDGLDDEYCPGDDPQDCGSNLSGNILFFHASSGAGVVTNDALDPVALPTILKRGADSLLIIGGWDSTGDAVSRSRAVRSCTHDADYRVSCSLLSQMNTARAGAVATCLGTDCDQVLVVGGNDESGAIAEILIPDDASASPVPLSSDDLPSAIAWAGLCGDAIVTGAGASDGVGALDAVVLALESAALSASFLTDAGGHGASLGASVAQAADGSCYVSGGLQADGGLSRSIVQALDLALAPEVNELVHARFGAASAVLGAGALEGGGFIAGGLTISADGARVEMVHGAEILRP